MLETKRPVPLRPFVFTGEDIVEVQKLTGRGFGLGPKKHGKNDRSQRGRPRKSAQSFAQQNFRLLDAIIDREHLPCIFFLFSRDFCEKMALGCMNRDLVSMDERQRLTKHWEDLRRDFEAPR